jgi:adenylate cyclase
MGLHLERERRFLVTEIPLGCVPSEQHRQCYLIHHGPLEVRVRTVTPLTGSVGRSVITVKLRLGEAVRAELEMGLHRRLAQWCHDRFPAAVRKTRHLLVEGTHLWELDRYHDRLEGLMTAELELTAGEKVSLPGWLGREVTGVPEYANRRLATAARPPLGS